MVLTDGWRKDVCALVREADVANIAEIDDVGSFYATAQVRLANAISGWALCNIEMSRDDVEFAAFDTLARYHPQWDKMQALIDSICSRLGIALEEVI